MGWAEVSEFLAVFIKAHLRMRGGFFILPAKAQMKAVMGEVDLNNIFANIAGYSFAVIVGHLCISRVINHLWKEVIGNLEKRQAAHLPKLIGLIERALYVGSFQIGKPEFIGVWIALKVAGQFKLWNEGENIGSTPVWGRVFYNIFLIGNGLSIAYAFIGVQIIRNLLNDNYIKAAIWALMILISTWVFNKVITSFVKKSDSGEPK